MNNSLDDFNINLQRRFLNVGNGYFLPLGNTYTISNPSCGGNINNGSSITVNGACEGNSGS